METFNDYGITLPRARKSGNVKCVCPKCRTQRSHPNDQPSLSVNIDRGVWKCHYCGWTGALRDNDGSWRSLLPSKRRYKRPEPRQILPPDQRTREWFAARGISKATLDAAPVDSGEEYFPDAHARLAAVRFNYLLCGQLINVKSRSERRHFALTPGAELIPWNIDAIADTPEAIITEGEIDALSFMEAGRTDVVSVPNGASARADYLDDFIDSHFGDDKHTVYIAVDTDAAGLKLRDELLRRLGTDRCRIVTYGPDCKDANELLMARGPKALTDALEASEYAPIAGLDTVGSCAQSLENIYVNGFPPGLTADMPNFDELCRMETRRLCVVTGIPSSGKSEFVDELVLRYCLRYGMRAAFYTPENYPTEYHAVKLIEKLGGSPFQASDMKRRDFDNAMMWLNDNIFHLNPPVGECDTDGILRLARSAVRRHGVSIVVIDPFNRIDPDPGNDVETTKISHMLDKMTRFAQEQNCLVIVVAHPRKVRPDEDGGVPDMYSVSGSANFYNKADFGIIVHRDKAAENVLVRVQKVKFRQLGQGGDCRFHYDSRCGRYAPFVDGTPCAFDTTPWLE